MAAMRTGPFQIGNHWWRVVDNETVAGPTYLREDVVRANGEIPRSITIRGGEPWNRDQKPNRAERRAKR